MIPLNAYERKTLATALRQQLPSLEGDSYHSKSIHSIPAIDSSLISDKLSQASKVTSKVEYESLAEHKWQDFIQEAKE